MARKPPPSKRRPRPCPLCGRPLSMGNRFCKACGWDADLAELEDAHLDGVDVPEAMTDGEYEEALAEEGLAPALPRRGRRPLWWATAVLLLATMLWGLLRFGSPW